LSGDKDNYLKIIKELGNYSKKLDSNFIENEKAVKELVIYKNENGVSNYEIKYKNKKALPLSIGVLLFISILLISLPEKNLKYDLDLSYSSRSESSRVGQENNYGSNLGEVSNLGAEALKSSPNFFSSRKIFINKVGDSYNSIFAKGYIFTNPDQMISTDSKNKILNQFNIKNKLFIKGVDDRIYSQYGDLYKKMITFFDYPSAIKSWSYYDYEKDAAICYSPASSLEDQSNQSSLKPSTLGGNEVESITLENLTVKPKELPGGCKAQDLISNKDAVKIAESIFTKLTTLDLAYSVYRDSNMVVVTIKPLINGSKVEELDQSVIFSKLGLYSIYGLIFDESKEVEYKVISLNQAVERANAFSYGAEPYFESESVDSELSQASITNQLDSANENDPRELYFPIDSIEVSKARVIPKVYFDNGNIIIAPTWLLSSESKGSYTVLSLDSKHINTTPR
jgi:hypothetical protein